MKGPCFSETGVARFLAIVTISALIAVAVRLIFCPC